MKFTEKEMTFFVSVSRGRVPFGITCSVPRQEEKEDFIKETIKSLTEKRILDENQKLTKEGADIIYLFEQYRNAKKHIRLNHVSMAVLSEGILITVIKTEDGYEMGCLQSAFLMTELLKHAEYLCREEKESIRGQWENIGQTEWFEQTGEMDGCVVLGQYHLGRLESEKIYYWKEDQGYLYHKTVERKRAISPGVMRKQIYRILEGSE